MAAIIEQEEEKSMALIKCKECGREVSDKANNCPNCGCPVDDRQESWSDNIDMVTPTYNQYNQKPKKGHGCLIGVIIFFAVIAVSITVGLNMNDNIQKEVSGVSDKSEYITMDEYDQIETGMSYKKVVKIIGSDGELSSKVDSNGYVIEIYTWYGNGVAGSNANVTFENGKVSGKAQVGLK
jgi:RNA polymerase subunit RPABC4/transcription elongation factor Spt4